MLILKTIRKWGTKCDEVFLCKIGELINFEK